MQKFGTRYRLQFSRKTSENYQYILKVTIAMQVPEFVPVYIIVGIVVKVSKGTGNNILKNGSFFLSKCTLSISISSPALHSWSSNVKMAQ
jgi:hypothetical protein